MPPASADPGSHKVVLPVLSENTRSATVVRVLVSEGERVEEGQPIFEMVTDKAEFDFESTASGTVRKLFVSRNAEIPSGFILALIGESPAPSSLVSLCQTENQLILQEFRDAVDISEVWADSPMAAEPATPPAASHIRATPAARRLARENALGLADVKKALAVEGMVKEEHVRDYLRKRREDGK